MLDGGTCCGVVVAERVLQRRVNVVAFLLGNTQFPPRRGQKMLSRGEKSDVID
jgi:hypothetical protein